MKVRHPSVAGMFYPNQEDELRQMIGKFLEKATPPSIKNLHALIVPHAGYVYSGPIAAYGYKLLEKQQFKNVIAIGPSHYAAFVGLAEDDSECWETPFGFVKTARISTIIGAKVVSCFPQAHAPEHCLEVQLPFLQTILKDFIFYPILTGEISPAVAANALEKVLDDDTLLLISSDLSHYLPYNEAVKRDNVTNKIICSLDVKNSGLIDACGKTGITIAMYIAKSKGWKVRLLDYRNSGDTAGPKSNVVGYSTIAFYEG